MFHALTIVIKLSKQLDPNLPSLDDSDFEFSMTKTEPKARRPPDSTPSKFGVASTTRKKRAAPSPKITKSAAASPFKYAKRLRM